MASKLILLNTELSEIIYYFTVTNNKVTYEITLKVDQKITTIKIIG